MIYIAVTLGLVAIAGALYFALRSNGVSPDSPTARALGDAASSAAKEKAHATAATIKTASSAELQARTDALRARGRSGK